MTTEGAVIETFGDILKKDPKIVNLNPVEGFELGFWKRFIVFQKKSPKINLLNSQENRLNFFSDGIKILREMSLLLWKP